MNIQSSLSVGLSAIITCLYELTVESDNKYTNYTWKLDKYVLYTCIARSCFCTFILFLFFLNNFIDQGVQFACKRSDLPL